jgi:hypothetical protein
MAPSSAVAASAFAVDDRLERPLAAVVVGLAADTWCQGPAVAVAEPIRPQVRQQKEVAVAVASVDRDDGDRGHADPAVRLRLLRLRRPLLQRPVEAAGEGY